MPDAPARDLAELMDTLAERAKFADPKISLGEIHEAVGVRAFGPLLFVAGLLTMTPVSGIPGVPSVLGLTVVLIAGQMLIGRDRIWLPGKLLRLKVGASKVEKSANFARKPARFLDRLVRPRLTVLTEGVPRRMVALACVCVGAVTPPLELIPFSTAAPATAITAFGLGLTARDGVVILIALAATAGTAGLVIWRFVG
ncbi:MAG: exopolysaccharide biosynthesis protein [Phenylobacterium sp.]|uniref:exopolysaccharide biosynthesis protein n=1 Tax=Phenylobacterium sp. TaxID=1871053 RepID=UPI00391CA7C3